MGGGEVGSNLLRYTNKVDEKLFYATLRSLPVWTESFQIWVMSNLWSIGSILFQHRNRFSQRQRWGNFWETCWSAYRLFRAYRYHFELNWTELHTLWYRWLFVTLETIYKFWRCRAFSCNHFLYVVSALRLMRFCQEVLMPCWLKLNYCSNPVVNHASTNRNSLLGNY